MGDTPKQEWAEKMADRVTNAIDRLAHAHAFHDTKMRHSVANAP